jgi:hypothetical protein
MFYKMERRLKMCLGRQQRGYYHRNFNSTRLVLIVTAGR